MKSELKEIQESNLLADKIEGFLVKVKQKLPLIIGVVVVGTVLLLVSGIYKTWSDSFSAKGWSALYFSDTEASDLESIAEDFPNTPAGLWARMAAGDSHLAQGVQSVNTNRDIADKHYNDAAKEYERVVSAATDGFLLARSNFGLAQAYEGLGKKEEAASSYRKITKLTNVDAEFQAEAAKRAAWLESSEAEEFFAWFKANRTMAPAIPPMTGGVPSVPGTPAFDLPGLPTSPTTPDSAPSTEKSAPAETSPEKATEAKTDAEKPVENPSSSDAPASDSPAASTTESK
jgi:tetratricopeptide (TPR) repeat protein